LSISAAGGSRATSAALTRRCVPLATSVTTTAARRAARSVFSDLRISSFIVGRPTDSVGPLPPCGGGLGRGVRANSAPRICAQERREDFSVHRCSRIAKCEILLSAAIHLAVDHAPPLRAGRHQSQQSNAHRGTQNLRCNSRSETAGEMTLLESDGRGAAATRDALLRSCRSATRERAISAEARYSDEPWRITPLPAGFAGRPSPQGGRCTESAARSCSSTPSSPYSTFST